MKINELDPQTKKSFIAGFIGGILGSVIGILVLAWITSAFFKQNIPLITARQLEKPRIIRSECERDAVAFCSKHSDDLAKDGCLQDNFEVVSPNCKAVLQLNRDALASCEPDMAKFCPGIHYGGGRIAKCLLAHKKNLSPSCSTRYK